MCQQLLSLWKALEASYLPVGKMVISCVNSLMMGTAFGCLPPQREEEIPSRKTANVITWRFYYCISQTSCALSGEDSGRVNISSGRGGEGKESTPVGLRESSRDRED